MVVGTVVVGRTAVVVVGGAALVAVVERSVATDGNVSDPVAVLLHDAPIAASPMSVMKICRRMFLREGIMIDMCGGGRMCRRPASLSTTNDLHSSLPYVSRWECVCKNRPSCSWRTRGPSRHLIHGEMPEGGDVQLCVRMS